MTVTTSQNLCSVQRVRGSVHFPTGLERTGRQAQDLSRWSYSLVHLQKNLLTRKGTHIFGQNLKDQDVYPALFVTVNNWREFHCAIVGGRYVMHSASN